MAWLGNFASTKIDTKGVSDGYRSDMDGMEEHYTLLYKYTLLIGPRMAATALTGLNILPLLFKTHWYLVGSKMAVL